MVVRFVRIVSLGVTPSSIMGIEHTFYQGNLSLWDSYPVWEDRRIFVQEVKMNKVVYRGSDYRNPHSYNSWFARPATVAMGLALFTLAMGFACVLASLAPV